MYLLIYINQFASSVLIVIVYFFSYITICYLYFLSSAASMITREVNCVCLQIL